MDKTHEQNIIKAAQDLADMLPARRIFGSPMRAAIIGIIAPDLHRFITKVRILMLAVGDLQEDVNRSASSLPSPSSEAMAIPSQH